MSDDLFTPTIKARPAPATPPWRPESIVYPAFFGGPLAATVLGVVNGRRLSLGAAKLWLIAAVGVAAFAGRVLLAALTDNTTAARFAGSVAGIAVWIVVNALQRRPFRAFQHGDTEPSSLVWPGIGAALGLGLLEAIVIFGVIR